MSNRAMVFCLAFVSFIAILTSFSIVPLMADIADDLTASLAAVGQAFTVAFLIGAALALILGPAGDHYGQRRLLVVGGVLAAAGTMVGALSPDYTTFVLTRIPAGLGGGVMAGLAVSLVSTRLPENERRVGVGWVITGISMATILGFPLMTEIGERANWRVSLAALSVLALAGTLLALVLVPRDGSWPKSPLSLSGAVEAYRTIFRDSDAVMLQVSNLVRAAAVFGGNAYIGGYMVTQAGLSLQVTGYVFLVGGVGYLVGSRLGDGTMIPMSLRTFYAVSTVSCGIALAAILSLPVGLLAICILYFLVNVGVGSGFVALNILILENTPGGTATAMALRQSGFSFGAASGGAIGGIVLAVGGFAVVGAMCVILSFLAALSGYWQVQRTRQPATGLSRL